jgi:hypothetical protein
VHPWSAPQRRLHCVGMHLVSAAAADTADARVRAERRGGKRRALPAPILHRIDVGPNRSMSLSRGRTSKREFRGACPSFYATPHPVERSVYTAHSLVPIATGCNRVPRQP